MSSLEQKERPPASLHGCIKVNSDHYKETTSLAKLSERLFLKFMLLRKIFHNYLHKISTVSWSLSLLILRVLTIHPSKSGYHIQQPPHPYYVLNYSL